MKVKEILLLIFIIIAGVVFYYAQTGKFHIEWNLGDYFFFGGEEFTFEESQVIDPPLPPLFKISNAHGIVEIQGTEESQMTISFQKKIWRKNEEEAKKVSRELQMKIQKNDLQIWLTTNREEFRRRNFETNFKITLPRNMDIEVQNSYGLVSVSKVRSASVNNRHGKIIASDIDGKLTLQNSYEDVEIGNVSADCNIESRHSDIMANGIKGKATIIHKYGKIHLEDVSNGVMIDGSHSEIFGQRISGSSEAKSSYEKISLIDVGPTKIDGHHCDLEIDGAKEYLEIIDSYGTIKLSNIEGNLIVKGRNVECSAKRIVGKEISISTTYRNIDLADFAGKTIISLSHGDVTLEPSLLSYPIEVRGEYSNISFYWPRGEKNPFEARTRNGEIQWKLAEELSFQEENHETIVKAFLEEKEKPSIFLSTSYGDIHIEELH